MADGLARYTGHQRINDDAPARLFMATWQPIESAPVGIDVLIYIPGQLPQIGQLDGGKWERSVNGRYHPLDDHYGDSDVHPTHWMPLPGPPVG